jgi:hypothetical protein
VIGLNSKKFHSYIILELRQLDIILINVLFKCLSKDKIIVISAFTTGQSPLTPIATFLVANVDAPIASDGTIYHHCRHQHGDNEWCCHLPHRKSSSGLATLVYSEIGVYVDFGTVNVQGLLS